ncbi:MAG: EAL domain-containing protein [Lachnospiraceae bacterium]|nr:EAL domain-containing protein [Lachnospiraceae bacterium]
MGATKRTILIVDDSKFNRAIVRSLLKDEYDVLEAGDGDEGLAILKEKYREISLVLLDLIMPKMTGYEFLEVVKKSKKLATVPIVVMTSSDKENEEETCLQLGAVDFIQKPYSNAIVKGRVNNIVRIREVSSTLTYVETDALTGLYTKEAFFYHAKQFIEANNTKKIDLVITDVENFKLVNSIYGETKSDAVVCHIARAFSCAMENGVIARYGGDKFVGIYTPDERMNDDWLRCFIDNVTKLAPIPNLVIKCGLYTNVDKTLSIETMCDRAMLAVRSLNGNYDTEPFTTYDGPVSQKHMRDKQFESSFQEAVENDEFVVWYQPKYDAFTEELVSAEALVRWQPKDGSIISPGEFIPVFEEDGLIVRLDEIVFRKVCTQIKKWLDEGKKVPPVSINLSRASLYHDGTVEKYGKIADEIGVPKQYIPIELTESAAFKSLQIQELTNRLKEAGFQLHMDDFGSGESSLASFNILPFDAVKLDKSLVDFIGDPGGDELLKYTIALAHFKDMKVVAEGVETKAQLETLKKLECDTIQGYYFAAPKPFEEYSRIIDEYNA